MAFTVRNLNIFASFLRGEGVIANNISFSLEKGESLAVVGESGCGKTMTALAVLGLLPDNCRMSGTITLDDTELTSLSNKRLSDLRGKKLVYIPQSGAEYLNPDLKIKTQIYEQLKICGIKGDLHKNVQKLLINAGLEEALITLEKYPFELSGGQCQRVTLALAMAASPELIIADEPMSGVDEQTADRLLDVFFRTFVNCYKILITHNISYAKLCDKILIMRGGVIEDFGKTADIFRSPVSAYTKLLIGGKYA